MGTGVRMTEGAAAGERVARRLRALGAAGDRTPEPREVDEAPCCVYGLVTRHALEELRRDVEEVCSRVNALIWTVGGAVVLDVVLRMVGR